MESEEVLHVLLIPLGRVNDHAVNHGPAQHLKPFQLLGLLKLFRLAYHRTLPLDKAILHSIILP